MAEFAEIDIQTEINAVRTAFKGSEVRDSIADGLQACQDDFNDAIKQIPTIAKQTITGTETITSSSSSSFLNTKLSLPFTPTINTRIVATLRRAGTPGPFINYCLTLLYSQTSATNASITAVICAGQNASGSPSATLPSGTYYVDWLVLDKGEAASTASTNALSTDETDETEESE
jgi:hypothetical protein